jgi:hypothetical protein
LKVLRELLAERPVRPLSELYAAANGADRLVPMQNEPAEAGLRLIPDHEWDSEREHVMQGDGTGSAGPTA